MICRSNEHLESIGSYVVICFANTFEMIAIMHPYLLQKFFSFSRQLYVELDRKQSCWRDHVRHKSKMMTFSIR